MKRLVVLAGVLPLFAFQVFSASTGGDTLVKSSKGMYTMIRSNVLKAAEEMPEADYSYKPVATVRTFGELIGHVADGQYEFCSSLMPSKDKNPEVEKTKKTKAELIEALKTSYSYCDKAYEGMTDAQAAEPVQFFGRPLARLSVLDFNIAHTDEHYGNLVTYLRMKGMVPPTSKQ